ncbi:MAG: hypothetical protein U1E60_02720 [Reyranellaceae bacterium]
MSVPDTLVGAMDRFTEELVEAGVFAADLAEFLKSPCRSGEREARGVLTPSA